MKVYGDSGSAPTYESVARQIGVDPEDIDRSFGIVLLDPTRSLYAVQARADRIPTTTAAESYQGPFANPEIGPLDHQW
jgi:hypothetical protein